MEYSGITFGVEVLLSIIFGAGGALGVWFKLKGTVNIQSIEIENMKNEVDHIKTDKKESNALLHKKVDDMKKIVDKNRENADNGLSKVTSCMNAMELRIIKAIHEIGKS